MGACYHEMKFSCLEKNQNILFCVVWTTLTTIQHFRSLFSYSIFIDISCQFRLCFSTLKIVCPDNFSSRCDKIYLGKGRFVYGEYEESVVGQGLDHSILLHLDEIDYSSYIPCLSIELSAFVVFQAEAATSYVELCVHHVFW